MAARACASGASATTRTGASRGCCWLATIPAAIIGFALEGFIEESFHGDNDAARLAIAGFLVVGAIGALAGRPAAADGTASSTSSTTSTALTIGLSQALALFPGISRSGATITAGLALGMTRESAARFSFLLATPITLGAGLYGSRRLLTESHTGTEWLAIVRRLRGGRPVRAAGHRFPARLAPHGDR